MSHAAVLTVQFLDFWHPGTGRTGGARVDALARRDRDGLPALPGRTLKGVLRDAVRRAENFGWYDDLSADIASPLDTLFGVPATVDGGSSPGALRVDGGRLGDAEISALADTDGLNPAERAGRARLREGLRREIFRTRIESGSGTAAKGSLRGMEVYVPLALFARVEWLRRAGEPPSWWIPAIRKALPLVDGLGANRSRGLGRAELTLEAS
ncbi:MAG TPA: RAMP superfamily CRISPR-associated protein [Xanthomonadaceae bacterium]|nr:RAMP superfamily CRISPR-associated protein [Xanthomonadaceae bacterium]